MTSHLPPSVIEDTIEREARAVHRSVARRYSVLARWYDTLSLEWPVYRVGRSRGIEGLELRAGDRVLDIACGTGLNFSLLRAAVGATGEIVGVDANPAMADRARRRIAAH